MKFFLTAVLGLSLCSSLAGATATPQELAKSYFQALRQGNFELLRPLLPDMGSVEEAQWRSKLAALKQMYQDVELVEVLTETEKTGQASVRFRLKKAGQKTAYVEGPILLLQNAEGQWKVGDFHHH